MLGLINFFFFVFFLRKLLENMISQYEGLNSERRREVQETRDLRRQMKGIPRMMIKTNPRIPGCISPRSSTILTGGEGQDRWL